MADFELQDEGTILVLYPCNEAASGWVAEHLGDDLMWWAGGVVVEHRYIGEIANAVHVDGLTVKLVCPHD
jgi:hypothetical protein